MNVIGLNDSTSLF